MLAFSWELRGSMDLVVDRDVLRLSSRVRDFRWISQSVCTQVFDFSRIPSWGRWFQLANNFEELDFEMKIQLPATFLVASAADEQVGLARCFRRRRSSSS